MWEIILEQVTIRYLTETHGKVQESYFRGNYDQARKTIEEMDIVGIIRDKGAEERLSTQCISVKSYAANNTKVKENKQKQLPWVTTEFQKTGQGQSTDQEEEAKEAPNYHEKSMTWNQQMLPIA